MFAFGGQDFRGRRYKLPQERENRDAENVVDVCSVVEPDWKVGEGATPLFVFGKSSSPGMRMCSRSQHEPQVFGMVGDFHTGPWGKATSDVLLNCLEILYPEWDNHRFGNVQLQT